MPYKVTYTTSTRPTDLPEGAVVEEVSALPLEFRTAEHGTEVSIHRRGELTTMVIATYRADMTDYETRRVRDALTEALGEATSPPSDGETDTKRRLIDGDYSTWFELSPGLWTLGSTLDQAKDNRSALLAFGHNLADNYADWSLGHIEAMYGIEVGPYAIR